MHEMYMNDQTFCDDTLSLIKAFGLNIQQVESILEL